MLGKNWGILLQTALEAQGTKDVKIYSSNINHSTIPFIFIIAAVILMYS